LKQAKEQLENAKEKLDQTREVTEEELARERIAKIVDRLKGLKERQDGAITESERLHKTVLQKSAWERELLTSLHQQINAQVAISKEAGFLGGKIKGAKVYAAILERSTADMDGAVEKMKAHTSLADI